MKRWKCQVIECVEDCVVEARIIPVNCPFGSGVVSWKKVEEPAPKPLSEAILPKLTVEVFDRDDCPEWAKYAIVAPSGKAYYTSTIPSYDTNKKAWGIFDGDASAIPGKFNASDWQNSLIERPEKKLPDWVKVGAWVWCADCRAERKIEKINGNRITVRFSAPDATSYTGDISEFKPARVRPWTFEEAPLQVKTKDDVLTLYFTISDTWEYKASKRIPGAYSLEEVTELTQADGSPCGVAEVAK